MWKISKRRRLIFARYNPPTTTIDGSYDFTVILSNNYLKAKPGTHKAKKIGSLTHVAQLQVRH